MRWVSEDGRTEVSVSPMLDGPAPKDWVVLEIVTPWYPTMSRHYDDLMMRIENARHAVYGWQRVYDASNVPVTTPGMRFDLKPGWVWVVTLQDPDKRMRYQFLGKPDRDFDESKMTWGALRIGAGTKELPPPETKSIQHDPMPRRLRSAAPLVTKAPNPKRRLRAYPAVFDFLIEMMRTDYHVQPYTSIDCVEGVPPDAKYLYTRSDDNGVYLIFEHPSFDEIEVSADSIIPFGKIKHSITKPGRFRWLRDWWEGDVGYWWHMSKLRRWLRL